MSGSSIDEPDVDEQPVISTPPMDRVSFSSYYLSTAIVIPRMKLRLRRAHRHQSVRQNVVE